MDDRTDSLSDPEKSELMGEQAQVPGSLPEVEPGEPGPPAADPDLDGASPMENQESLATEAVEGKAVAYHDAAVESEMEEPPADAEILKTSSEEPEESADGSPESQDYHAHDQATALFDYTRPFHALKDASRHILQTAALLHNFPLPPTKKKPLKAVRALIRSSAADEFSSEGRKVLAAVLAYHRGKIRRKHFDKLDLSPVQQREALTIAALLRMATGLNASKSSSTMIRDVDLGHDEMWVVVDGPEATIDAAAAQHSSSLWVKIGYPEIKVMGMEEAAAKRVPFPELTETIGILPKDSMSEAGRKVMRFNFARMLSHEDGTVLGEDIEALHDMRVATRRMRAAFEVFGEAFDRQAMKSHLKGLRMTGRALGAVRDLDVFMDKAEKYIGTLAEEERSSLDILLQTWQDARESARVKMLAHLNSPEYHTFKREFNIFLNTPGAGARPLPKDQPTPDLVCEVAPMLIYTRLAAVRAYDPWLEDAPIERLHALRIEFKKLRYTVEYFREVLGSQAEMVIDELKTIQDHLGDLNDAQVATEILRAYIDDMEASQADLPVDQRANLEPVVTYLAYQHDERHRLMMSFKDVWRHFNRKALRKKISQAVSVL